MALIGTMKPYPYVVAIIQARLDSQRLPRKVLADVEGLPMLAHVIGRTVQAKTVHQVVVASPDEEVVTLASERGVWGYKDMGDPNNVLARYLTCSNWCDADIVVRITGDCPLIDPAIIDICVKAYLDNRVDISTNVRTRTFMRGFDVEVLHKNVLKRIFHLTKEARYREHVTLFAHEHPELFVWKEILHSEDNSTYNMSVDTGNDLATIRRFMHYIGSGSFSYEDALRWHELDSRSDSQGRSSS